ncbi:MAG: hypothetical protein ABR899_09150 [Candidatus Krumholzibacteriaceae bacterium]|jgi:hypothetical protein
MEIQLKQVPKKWHTATYENVVTQALAEAESGATLRPARTHRVHHPLMAAAGLALLAYGVLFIVWTSHRVDRMMRDEIFVQAQMVAQAVDFTSVSGLSGSAADLTSPGYLKLKEQLTLIRRADPKCRFIYLMGRGSDGKLFFYVDSEDPDSPDYSPPGQRYDEASKVDYQVFATGSGNVEGPYKDRWGTWISAMVPVLQPDDQKLLAVLGMDFNAESWKWDVSTRTALPASSALLAFFLGLYLLAAPFRIACR